MDPLNNLHYFDVVPPTPGDRAACGIMAVGDGFAPMPAPVCSECEAIAGGIV